jgi:hypothetical protein
MGQVCTYLKGTGSSEIGHAFRQAGHAEKPSRKCAVRKPELKGDYVDAVLDASVQFIQLALILVVIMQNFNLRARMRRLEEKVGR